MQGVKLSDERAAIEPASFCYLPAEGAWSCDYQGCDYYVGGGPDGPDPTWLDVARFVAAKIGEFTNEADGYLAEFVAPERFGASRPWHLVGAKFGSNADDPNSSFEMQLVLDGDTDGLWSVGFELAGPPLDRCLPVRFSRRQS